MPRPHYLVAAETYARNVLDLLADAIAPPIGRSVTAQPAPTVCLDPDHDEPESPCSTCGQGPRRRQAR